MLLRRYHESYKAEHEQETKKKQDVKEKPKKAVAKKKGAN